MVVVLVVGGEGRQWPSLGAVAIFFGRRVSHGVDRGGGGVPGGFEFASWDQLL